MNTFARQFWISIIVIGLCSQLCLCQDMALDFEQAVAGISIVVRMFAGAFHNPVIGPNNCESISAAGRFVELQYE